MKFSPVDEEELSVNLAPLIDVVFLLLIFFMVTTTFNRNAAMEVALPEAAATASDTEQKKVFITVNALGEVLIEPEEGKVIRQQSSENVKVLAELLSQTATSMQKNAEPSDALQPIMVIQADKAAQHGHVINLMEAIGLAKLTQIEFAVKPIQR